MDGPAHNEMILELGYKSLIDHLPCYLSIQDPSMRMIFANGPVTRDFGDCWGKLCHEVYKGSSQVCPSCPVQKSFEDNAVHLGEETVVMSDGTVEQMLVYSVPLTGYDGRVNAVMELSTNITQVKTMQEELSMLGRSMALLSHDIKNILEGLQGGVYVVDEGFKDGDDTLIRRGWDVVKRNVAEISTVVQNILAASKKRTPRYTATSPGRIAADVTELFRDSAQDMGIRLTTRANPSLPLTNLDPVGVKRMLSNLICNALEACRNDTSKDGHAVEVRVDFFDEHNVSFEVEDDGTGMDDDTCSNIFTDFYSTKGTGGTGLGLLVVDKIVKEHGGRMDVLTALGKGSTFRAIVPLR